MLCGSQEFSQRPSERGMVRAPCVRPFPATSKLPGMTGTGSPVTERLRCSFGSELGWDRERLAPKLGERFIFLKYFMEVISNGKETLRRK